ncbi:hypothetical protein L596_026962 [Steinernema carpocapsae]|uniref:G-protein coupled receptors family 1 profile domain-containing protein n=1 Tax=Steinernema carpocapsae TaxID=34508 RepID=A0A4V5ZYC2_STECR|nr:hypothetical protein L596_026962 [Steinernema carpocapsae]
MSNQSDAEVCKSTEELSRNWGFLVNLATRAFIGISGIACSLIVAKYANPTSSFHPNARFILKIHFCAVLTACVGLILGDGFDFLRMTIFKQIRVGAGEVECPVPLILSSLGCTFRSILLFGNLCSVMTMSCLAVERVVATVKVGSYDGRKKGLGYVVVGIMATIAVGLIIWQAVSIDIEPYVAFATFKGRGTAVYRFLVNMQIALDCFNCTVFFCLLLANCYMKKQIFKITVSLPCKYQISENRNAICLLLPLAIFHMLIYSGTFVLIQQFAVTQKDTASRVRMSILVDLMPFYDILLPVVLLWRHFVHKRAVAKMNTVNFIGKLTSPLKRKKIQAEQQTHFAMLDKMFSKP